MDTLCCAIASGNNSLIRFIYNHVDSLQQVNRELAVRAAVEFHHLDALRWLLESAPDGEQTFLAQVVLFHACELGCADAFNYIVNHPSLTEATPCDNKTATALHAAVRMGDLVLVSALLDTSIGKTMINMKDRLGRTPLHNAVEAIIYNNYDENQEAIHSRIFELLMHQEAIVSIQDKKGSTPLHYAIQYASSCPHLFPMIQPLIQKSGRLNQVDNDGYTPLSLAITMMSGPERLNVIKSLITAGADVNGPDINASLLMPCVNDGSPNSFAVAECLLKHGAFRNQAGIWHPLHQAIESKRKDMVQLLFDNGVNIDLKNSAGELPLDVAVRIDDQATIELILKRGRAVAFGVNPDSSGSLALHLAIENNNVDMLKLLMRYEGKVAVSVKDAQGRLPLDMAIETRNKNMAQIILKDGGSAAFDVKDSNSWSTNPFHRAVETGDVDLVRLCMENGGEVALFTRDAQGRTPLDIAKNAKNRKMSHLILDYELDNQH